MPRSLLQLVLKHADGLAADPDPDALLLRRFVSTRDESAFAALVKRHGPMVWAVCRQSVPNRADAEDVFQATFVALSTSAGRIRHRTQLGGWLYAAAVRIAGKAKRSFLRRRSHERATAKSEADTPVSAAAWGELTAAVHEEVAKLPASLRAVFVLCDLQGVEPTAAAGQLGVKANSLTGQLARARQRLMDALGQRGIAAGAVALGTAVAVPEALATQVAGGVVPSAAVLELATEITTMGVSKLKLLAAGLLVAGGLTVSGLGLLANAGAQVAAAPPGANPFGPGGIGGPVAPPIGVPGVPPAIPPGGIGGPVAPPIGVTPIGPPVVSAPAKPFEYLFAAKPGTLAEVAKVLNEKAAKGWEYTGPLDVDPAEPKKSDGFEGVTKDTRVVLVFKRAAKQPVLGGPPGGPMLPGGGSDTLPPKLPGGSTPPKPGGGGDANDDKPKAFVVSTDDAKDFATTIPKLFKGVTTSTLGDDTLIIIAPTDAELTEVVRFVRDLSKKRKEGPKPGGTGTGSGPTTGPGGTPPPKDPDGDPSERYEVIALKNASAEEAAKVLSEVFNGAGKPAGRVRIVAEKTSNSLVVVKASDADLKAILKLMDTLDVKAK